MPGPVLYLAGDESGSLTNPHTPVVSVACIITYNPAPLRWIIPRVKRNIHKRVPKHRRGSEFKFHNVTDSARCRVLSHLAQEDVTFIAFNIYKGAQIIPDIPENYGLLLGNLLVRSVGIAPRNVRITFDNHYTRAHQREALDMLIQSRLQLDTGIRFVDSQKNRLVQLADFVAAAIHYAHTGRTLLYYNLIKERIAGDELSLWKDARREWLQWETKKDRYQQGLL